jgi:hypothetical protein
MVLTVISFVSCTKSPENFGNGTAEFAISLPGGSGQLKSANLADTAATYQLMVSFTDLLGKPVITDKLIPLYAFGTSFVSEKLEIPAGDYKLVKFMVINPAGTVVYASPLIGSPMAYLANKPLPFVFNIVAAKVTQIIPEVLVVGNETPDKFGYATFGVQVIKPLTFWTAVVLDNPMIMAPSPLFTTARLTVWAKDGWHFTFNLVAGVNQLAIRGGSDVYTFSLEKEGYTPQKLQFTATQLLATTKEHPLYLKIPYNSEAVKTLVLQPGPDAGKDAMISNLEPDKNFGTYKYFEATYLSESPLTVMRSNRSLIWFDLSQLPKPVIIKKVVLHLYYDLPLAWDSTIFARNTSGAAIIQPFGVLQQITKPWEENTVTWNNQPTSIETNQVIIYPFIRNVNYIELDVTRLFLPVAISSATTDANTVVPTYVVPNYGMLFKLSANDKFHGFRFASSDFPEATLRPKLTIQYTQVQL